MIYCSIFAQLNTTSIHGLMWRLINATWFIIHDLLPHFYSPPPKKNPTMPYPEDTLITKYGRWVNLHNKDEFPNLYSAFFFSFGVSRWSICWVVNAVNSGSRKSIQEKKQGAIWKMLGSESENKYRVFGPSHAFMHPALFIIPVGGYSEYTQVK